MEENVMPQPVPSVDRKNPLLCIGVIMLMIGVAGIFYYVGMQRGKGTIKNETPEPAVITQTSAPTSSAAIFNLNGGDPSLKYFISQITAPGDYFATDDNMLESYLSQGGMAPPRLILMKNYQVSAGAMEDQSNYDAIFHQLKNDCIAIWSTNGFTSIEDWNSNITQFKGPLSENQNIAVGKRTAHMAMMSTSQGNIYVAFLSIGNKDNTSYYFNTCNTDNKSDFVQVIQSIKFRDDVSL